MKVWRIHLKNDEAKNDHDRAKLKKMCLDERIIGVGWSKITTREDSEDKIRKQAQENYDGNNAEELVILYLQFEKEYRIYSSTMKATFPVYECQMVNKDGYHAYPQVKTGNEILKADDYMIAFEKDPGSEVFLFATSQRYVKNKDKRIKYLTTEEIENFARENINILPYRTRLSLELTGILN